MKARASSAGRQEKSGDFNGLMPGTAICRGPPPGARLGPVEWPEESDAAPTLSDALKDAMKARDVLTLSTLRLMLARLKERDIEERPKGNDTGIADPAIEQMLQGMIKQRHDAIALYEQGARPELAAKERAEIVIIERFLPQKLSPAEQEQAIRDTIAAIGASGIKDMGRTMAALRERYAGQMDFGKAASFLRRGGRKRRPLAGAGGI